jgi:phosphoglycerol transferase MdoB-like AlkP superfamily enzyme
MSARKSQGAHLTACARSKLGFGLFWIAGLLIAWTLLRLTLHCVFGPKGSPWSEVALAFLAGAERDLFVATCLLTFLYAYMWLVPERVWSRPWHRALFWSTGGIGIFFFLFLLAVEYFFFEEFKSRFNTVAVDYLIYPHEVFVNIWQSYHTGIIIAMCAAASGAWLWVASRQFSPMWNSPVPRRLHLASLGGCLAVALLCSLGIGLRSPHVSSNRTLNEIANDGPLSFVAAFWTHQLDYSAFYHTLSDAEAYQRARRLLSAPNSHFLDPSRSIRREVDGDPNRPKLNLVVILEESLGSPFWGCLGASPSLTPNMDSLTTREGLLFANIYASGNRTVRGMEGVLSSFPPLPGDSIVKRHLTDNVETLARVLRRDGYTNLFLYGGRGVFDSMRSYAVRNGYDRFVEQSDFKHPSFSTIWGVCDEDLFARGIEEFRELSHAGRPFFATLLTVSNHRPYTFPPHRIPDVPGSRESVVKYADFALGQFFDQARREDFWTNTLFAVVADHGARVYGKQTIPIKSYEIPFVVLGPAGVKAPARIDQLGCSLDVSPTLLGLIGRPYETTFFGRDLLHSSPETGHVFLNHNRDVGMLAQERLVVLGLMQSLEFYAGDPKRAEMAPLTTTLSELDLELARDCMAIYQVADDLYMNQRYTLDTSLSPPSLTARAVHPR